jgi:cytochrome c-type biogenesis protein
MLAGVGETIASGSLLAAIPIAVFAGLVSFASPCVLPLVPGYLGYLSGMSAVSQQSVAVGQVGVLRSTPATPPRRGRLVAGVALFVLGFSSVFIAIGFVTGSLGILIVQWSDRITMIAGVLIIALGLAFVGLVPALSVERKPHIAPRAGLLGAPVLGFSFGLGWTPCIGPTLGAIVALSVSEASAARGAILATAYSIGLGLPFLAIALGMERSKRVTDWLRRHRLAVQRFGGGLLMALGLAMVTGLWGTLSSRMQWLFAQWSPSL